MYTLCICSSDKTHPRNLIPSCTSSTIIAPSAESKRNTSVPVIEAPTKKRNIRIRREKTALLSLHVATPAWRGRGRPSWDHLCKVRTVVADEADSPGAHDVVPRQEDCSNEGTSSSVGPAVMAPLFWFPVARYVMIWGIFSPRQENVRKGRAKMRLSLIIEGKDARWSLRRSSRLPLFVMYGDALPVLFSCFLRGAMNEWPSSGYGSLNGKHTTSGRVACWDRLLLRVWLCLEDVTVPTRMFTQEEKEESKKKRERDAIDWEGLHRLGTGAVWRTLMVRVLASHFWITT